MEEREEMKIEVEIVEKTDVKTDMYKKEGKRIKTNQGGHIAFDDLNKRHD